MRRKTFEHPLPLAKPTRANKKYKTQFTDRKNNLPFTLPTHSFPQSLTSSIIYNVLDSVDLQIHDINIDRCAVKMVEEVGRNAYLIEEGCCPEDHEGGFGGIVVDQEPVRIEFDPICGFNKLVTKHKKKELDITLKEKRKQTLQIPTLLSIRKKSTDKVEIENGEKLVPLSKFSTDKQKEQYETMLRERVIYETRNLLRPSIIIPRKSELYEKRKGLKTQKFGQSMQKNGIEEYVYGYKGQKQLLSLNLGKNLNSGLGGNSIIKTSYRINNDVIQKTEKENEERELIKKKNREQTGRNNHIESRKDYKKKQSLNMIKFIAETANSETQVKSLLESEFKKTQKSNVKWKEKLEKLPQQRFSKIF